MMNPRTGLGFALLASLAALTGCGGTTVKFEMQNVINAWTDADSPRAPLEVDIVCMTSADVDAYPEIVNRAMTSDQWFNARRNDRSKIARIPPEHIFALRYGAPDASRDRKLRDALVSPKDTESADRTVTVEIKHPDPGGKAVIAIFGAFTNKSGSGFAPTPPLIINPPGAFGSKEIVIDVGKTSLSRRSE